MRKTFRYRLYPTKAQARRLARTLEECRWTYNQLLEQRKVYYEEAGINVSMYAQHQYLPFLKDERPSLREVHSQVLQNVSERIDLAFQAFFRRIQNGENPGYPRFRGADRYNSLIYPQYGNGARLDGDRLCLSKIGHIEVVLHRSLSGTPKTATVLRSSTGKWYVSIACEEDPTPLPNVEPMVGIDVGLASFATLSTGEQIANPRFFRNEERALARVQRTHSKLAAGSRARRKHRKAVARVHERVRWRRENFAHQHSRRIVNQHQVIAVEDLAVNQMLHNHCLAKSISDAAWTQFSGFLAYKAAWAGRHFVPVNPAYTSQDCHACGHRQQMPLAERIFTCPGCGVSCDRDHNAALNILARGLASIGSQSVAAPGSNPWGVITSSS